MSIVKRQKRYGYAVFCNVDLSKKKKGRIEWTLFAKKLIGLVGYGITTFPFPIDVKKRANFDENTIMVRNNSGFINGGKSDKEQKSGIQWKAGEEINCCFDQEKRCFSMKKVRRVFDLSYPFYENL